MMKKLKDILFNALKETHSQGHSPSGTCTSGCCKFHASKVNCPHGHYPGCPGSQSIYGGMPSRCNFVDGNVPVIGDKIVVSSGNLAGCVYEIHSVMENGPRPANKNHNSGDCPPPPPGCPSGLDPTFQFNTSCDPNANYHTWAGGYSTIGNSFMWQGGTITDPISGNVINNGDLAPDYLVNLINANQSSYCEWCDDFAQGGGSSVQFGDWLPLWHSPQQTTPWPQTGGPTPPEAHCCCCPGQGGASINPTLALSVAPPFDDTGIDPTDIDRDREPTSDTCCAWCATVDPNIPSKPPAGCYDFDCNDCPGFKPKPTIIPENLIRALQIRAGIIK